MAAKFKYRFYTHNGKSSVTYHGNTLEEALEKFQRLHNYDYRHYDGKYIVRPNNRFWNNKTKQWETKEI